jgi:hypothetical protein
MEILIHINYDVLHSLGHYQFLTLSSFPKKYIFFKATPFFSSDNNCVEDVII